jgi:hypothetical protein
MTTTKTTAPAVTTIVRRGIDLKAAVEEVVDVTATRGSTAGIPALTKVILVQGGGGTVEMIDDGAGQASGMGMAMD